MIEIVTLVLILLSGETATRALTYEFRGEHASTHCKDAEAYAHDLAKITIGVIDVGTICLTSQFDPRVKPAS